MLYLEFLFLFFMLYLGSRFSGVGLGALAALGLMVEVFIFRMPLAEPPVAVMLIILSVVTCAAVLEAAGGLKYMLQIAERILRNNPKRITILGPFATYIITLLLGTGHAVYSIMPIIGDVALKNNIRPERPMAAASVASQIGICASPIAAVTVYYLSQLAEINPNINLLSIIMVTIPSTAIAVLLISLYSLHRGKELSDDPEYQKRLKDPKWQKILESKAPSSHEEVLPSSAKTAVLLFLVALLSIIFVAMVPEVRTIGQSPIPMDKIIQMMMLGFAGIILLVTRTSTSKIPEGVVFKSGMVATIAIFGIAWMSDTFFQYAMPVFKASITDMVHNYPWTFALALAAVSVVVNSQAATARIMLPVGLGLGLPPEVLIGLIPATYAYFFFPVYPSDVATCNFDISGTTKVGKWYFNHSFMIPGLIGISTACCVGYILAHIIIS